MINYEVIERFIVGFLQLGDGKRPPAIGRQNACPRHVVEEYVRRMMRPINREETLGRKEEELSDDVFRKVYAQSKRGICACEDGLYLADSAEDVEAAEKYLMKKYMGLLARIKRIREAYPEYGPYKNQLTINFNEIEE